MFTSFALESNLKYHLHGLEPTMSYPSRAKL